MTSVQVRGVSDEVLALLKRRAAGRGLSLQRYLRSLFEAEAGVERNNDILDEAAADQGNYVADEGETVRELRRARDERERQLDRA
jgi:plasmid stability protein